MSAPAALSAVEADFPGWHAWKSRGGTWWATRTGARASYRDGLPMTLDADDEEGLRERLAAAGDAAAVMGAP